MPYKKLMELAQREPLVKAIVDVRNNDLKRLTLQFPAEPKGFSIKERPQPGDDKALRLALRNPQGMRFALGTDGVWPAIQVLNVSEETRKPDDYMILEYRKLVDTDVRLGGQRYAVKAMVTEFLTEYDHQEIPTMGGRTYTQCCGPQRVTVRVAIEARWGHWPTFYTLRGVLWADKNLADSRTGNERKLARQAQGFWQSLKPAERRLIQWVVGVLQANGRNALLNAPIPEDFRLRYQASQIWLALTAHEDDEYKHPVKVKNVCKYVLGLQAFKTKKIEDWEAQHRAEKERLAEEARQKAEALEAADCDTEPDCD